MNFFQSDEIECIRKGYYSAVYFNRTKEILEKENNKVYVALQLFQKQKGSVLCGIEEVEELLKVGSGYWEKKAWIDTSNEITVESLADGDTTDEWETVMHIEGPYQYFAHLESVYLGILARRTLVATNVRTAVNESNKKPIFFFADRFDDFRNQKGDGYAARVGGVSGVCTQAMSDGFGEKPVGTIPHSLIAMNNGNTIAAAKQFIKHFPNIPLIVLVDFDNDCVKTSLALANALKDALWGIRIDTAENLIDESIKMKQLNNETCLDSAKWAMKQFQGVNPELVKNVRTALNNEGFDAVKIVVSGGFDDEKIKWFEDEKTPVDVYGVGSSLLKGNNDFTADIVKVDGKLISKFGREFKKNNRLTRLF